MDEPPFDDETGEKIGKTNASRISPEENTDDEESRETHYINQWRDTLQGGLLGHLLKLDPCLHLPARLFGDISELKGVAADFYHALILFCKGKALKIVLTNKEGEGFEAWRALVNKYEPTSKASVVGKLAEILRTPFDG